MPYYVQFNFTSLVFFSLYNIINKSEIESKVSEPRGILPNLQTSILIFGSKDFYEPLV